MMIEQFINEKIIQIRAYVHAVMKRTIHHTELDKFIVDTMEEWTCYCVEEETPNNAKERVFWHIIHEISLHGSQALHSDLYFKSEISTCIDFFEGKGSYPIDCIGWRPLP